MWFQIFVSLIAASVATTSAYVMDVETIKGETCSVYHTQGYSYKNWFNITKNVFNTAEQKTLLLKFYVQGARDAHIMLTTQPSTIGYEIVLGGGFNSFCDLRKYGESLWSMNIDNILNKSKPVGFWIRISQDIGQLEVGKDEEPLPFMFWKDPDMISPIRYYSFSSWNSVVCKWFLNCRKDAVAENISYAGKFLSYTERLRKYVINNYNLNGTDNPTKNPQQLLNVAITNYFKFIHLDVMTSTLTLRGFATFEWTDNGVRWDPRNYKNISRLHLSNYELWRPELIVHNAIDPTASSYSEAKITIDNKGKVIWRPKFDIKTKCDINIESWPWDQHKCIVHLSTWSHKITNIFYEFKENDESKCSTEIHSDWKLDRMTYSYIEDETPWNDIIASVYSDDRSKNPNQISIQLMVEISRNTQFFEKLFYAPLIMISCLWLSSFCFTSNYASKITIICTSIILSTLIVAYMTTYVPVFSEASPNLMIGYLKLMLLISMDALISSFFMTIHNRKTIIGHPPFAITRFLTIPIVTNLLILPKINYTPTPDDQDQCNDKAEEEQETTATLWDIVIVASKRILFIVNLVIVVIELLSIKISVKS